MEKKALNISLIFLFFFLLGKVKVLKQSEGNQFRELSTCFGNLSKDQLEIGEAGIQLMTRRYSLDKLL